MSQTQLKLSLTLPDQGAYLYLRWLKVNWGAEGVKPSPKADQRETSDEGSSLLSSRARNQVPYEIIDNSAQLDVMKYNLTQNKYVKYNANFRKFNALW